MVWEVWDLSRSILSWFYKLLTGKSGYEVISWRVSLLSNTYCISTTSEFSQRNAFLAGFKGPKGHETHSAHNWLCKRKTVKLQWWGGFPLHDCSRVQFQLCTCSSGPQNLDIHTHTRHPPPAGRNTADMWNVVVLKGQREKMLNSTHLLKCGFDTGVSEVFASVTVSVKWNDFYNGYNSSCWTARDERLNWFCPGMWKGLGGGCAWAFLQLIYIPTDIESNNHKTIFIVRTENIIYLCYSGYFTFCYG